MSPAYVARHADPTADLTHSHSTLLDKLEAAIYASHLQHGGFPITVPDILKARVAEVRARERARSHTRVICRYPD